MCIAVPMRVLSCDETSALCEARDGSQVRIDTLLVGEVQPGQWLSTFLGTAREILSEEQARLNLAALAALEAVMNGETDVDAHFADLIEREPQLPDFLGEDT
jgi:hydrogenase expression/formation protein HypC